MDEYHSKVTSLLKASGSDIKPQISIVNSDQGLVQGIQVKETSARATCWAGFLKLW